MVFKKSHKLGATSDNPLDKTPLCLKLDIGVKDQIRSIPDWQKKVRKLLKNWAAEQSGH